MDHGKWMYEIGHSEEAYMKGVLSFLEIAEANRLKNRDLEIWCPCKDYSPQWRKIDNKFDKFSDEIKNIRFGLSSDGPKQPGNDIDVYLDPLIDDMKTLWGSGVEDIVQKVNLRVPFVKIRHLLGGYLIVEKLCSWGIEYRLKGINREIKAYGPVYLHYMYPFERYIGFLKGFVRNRARPDASIVQGYYSEELIEFASSYLKGVENIGIPHFRHEGRLLGVETIGLRAIDPDRDLLEVMENFGKNNIDKIVQKLGEVPKCVVRSYQGYEIIGFTFYTKEQDEKSTTQNSEVIVITSTMEFDRMTHDARSMIAKMSYYGVIQEIWELDYHSITIPLFKCKWVTNNQQGVNVDEEGFTLVDLSTNGYTSDPFVLAKLATQVFFVKDPSKPRWYVVLDGKRRILGVDNVVNEDEYNQFDELPPFSFGVSLLDDNIISDTYLRCGHEERLWVDDTFT
ncbi:hypothetical protein Tco_0794626 [Tanacetum coccineum]